MPTPPVRPHFLLQMAGGNGSGKSSVAQGVAAAIGAVVLDHDTTKTAIMSAGIGHPPAGAASYEVLFSLTSDLLAQGHSVVIDSPSAYESVPARGLAVAAAEHVRYFFVECDCPTSVCDERIGSRPRRPSQVADAAAAAEVRASPTRRPHRPASGALVVDTTRALDACVASTLAYLRTGGATGPVVAH